METDLYQIHHHPRLAERLHIHAEPEVQSIPADVNTGTRPEIGGKFVGMKINLE